MEDRRVGLDVKDYSFAIVVMLFVPMDWNKCIFSICDLLDIFCEVCMMSVSILILSIHFVIKMLEILRCLWDFSPIAKMWLPVQ